MPNYRSRKARKARDVARAELRRLQGAGRPKVADIARYPSGRPKPPTPNEVVVAHRRALLDNPGAKGLALQSAENALDLMLARGWLTKPLHETAANFRRLYLAAFPTLPDLRVSDLREADERISGTGLNFGPTNLPNPDGNPSAMEKLRTIWRVMRAEPKARDEVLSACLVAMHWPTWLQAMIAGRALSGDEQAARKAFFRGLHIVGQVLAIPSLDAQAA